MDEIRQKLYTALSQRKELWEWIQKLDSGTGTYEDVAKIAEALGDKIAEELAPAYTEELLEAYAVVGHEIVSMAGEVAQQNLNDAARIGVKPMTTSYPNSKVKALAAGFAGADSEILPKEIKTAVPSLLMEMVDDIVKYNVDFQAKAGLKPVIVRTWSGSYGSHDTKHTDWCHDLAGTYEYGKEPKRVFARHKGCRCKVEYFPNIASKGRITALAKGEIDRESVLWNTRAETLEARIAKAQREANK